MSEQNATPRPWIYDDNTATIDSGDPAIAVAGINVELDEYEANAELIVRAVNAHDELVAALEAAERVLSVAIAPASREDVTYAVTMIRAALAKARGES